jgi:hypothetical protein
LDCQLHRPEAHLLHSREAARLPRSAYRLGDVRGPAVSAAQWLLCGSRGSRAFAAPA